MPDYVCGAKPQRGEPCTIQFDQFTGSVLTDCEGAEGLTCDQFTLTCQPYPGDGQPCNPFGLPQCDPDPTLALSCNQFSGTCRRPGAEGAPCGAPAIPPCRADLACHPTQPDGIGTCGAVPALGEPCADRCASPAVCASGTCVSTGAAAVGEPCASDADCSSLSCNGFQGGRRVCGVPPYTFAQCMGAGITAARVTGAGGIGGPMGTAGSFGGPDGGVGARGTPPTGAGGMGGTGNTMPTGCLSSDIAPGDPMIADFGVDMGGMAVLPIGGTFTYGSPAPTAFVSNKAWHLTLTASGIDGTPLFLGAGIFFNRCTDATAHTGVQFDISGTVGGTGCTAQYATNDSAHMDVTFDPKGAGPAGSWSPQAPLAVTTTPTTVLMPFVGTGAPTGGSPPIPIDPSKLTGVQWQFTVASGTTNGCIVDVTIDNVRFF
jgi:hypothetical protein